MASAPWWLWGIGVAGWLVAGALILLYRAARPRSWAPLRAVGRVSPEERLEGKRNWLGRLLADVAGMPEYARREGLARLSGGEAGLASALLGARPPGRGDFSRLAGEWGLDEGEFLDKAGQTLARMLPGFRRDRLVRLLCLDRREKCGAVTLHWLTLEVYRGGLILRAHCEGGADEAEAEAQFLLRDVRLEDDLGQVYPHRGSSGGELQFAPGLDSRARELRVTVGSVVRWVSPNPRLLARPWERQPPREEIWARGPWTFAFPLAAGEPAGEGGGSRAAG